jgi:hypothetical protein
MSKRTSEPPDAIRRKIMKLTNLRSYFHKPSPAMIVALLALFVALGGTAMAAYVVSSNSQIGPNTVSGHKPPSGAHSNIISGSINGQDVADNSLGGADINETTLTGDTRRLNYNAPATSVFQNPPSTPIATVGPYTIKGRCSDAPGGVGVYIDVHGPAGTADSVWSETVNDTTDRGTHSSGLLIPANSDYEVVSTGGPPGDYGRAGGTSMLRAGGVTVQVDFDMVADARSSHDCFIYGTATRAT